MSRPLRWGALLCLMSCACGCGDSPRIVVRDVLSTRNELVDAMLKVTDEASAKSVADTEIKKLHKRWDEGLRKRLEEWQQKVLADEKGFKKNSRLSGLLEKGRAITRDDVGNEIASANPNFFETQNVLEDNADEIKATAKRLDNQLQRIGKIFDKVWKGSKDDVKGLTAVLNSAQIFGTRDQAGETDWGPPLRIATVKVQTVPLRKHRGVPQE